MTCRGDQDCHRLPLGPRVSIKAAHTLWLGWQPLHSSTVYHPELCSPCTRNRGDYPRTSSTALDVPVRGHYHHPLSALSRGNPARKHFCRVTVLSLLLVPKEEAWLLLPGRGGALQAGDRACVPRRQSSLCQAPGVLSSSLPTLWAPCPWLPQRCTPSAPSPLLTDPC